MKKIIICVFDALNAYHESNTKMIEKIRDEATQKALILEAYSLKRCMELLLKEEPDELFVLDSVGISGAILLLKQIKKSELNLPTTLICDEVETITYAYNAGVETVIKSSDFLEISRIHETIF